MPVSLGRSITPPNTRIYAVGDVHGHIKLLEIIHTLIRNDLEKNPVDDYKLIFLGDYIDRGPDSAGCIEYLINLMAENNNVICLKGNHEDKLENFLADPIGFADSFFTYGGIDTAVSYGIDMAEYRGRDDEISRKGSELSNSIPAHHKSFYSKLDKSVTFGAYMFVHAGVRPGVALDQQSEDDLIWIRSEFITNQQLYEKVIIHGHTPAYPMEVQPNRINVDTHAYQTGVLSCLVLQGSDYRVIEATPVR